MNTMPQRLAMRLIRLYPRAWRERYEQEMLALVEETGLGWRHVADMVVGAVREQIHARLAWSAAGPFTRVGAVVALVTVIASIGTGVAMLLAQLPTPPRISIESGRRLVSPPALPGLLSGLAILVQFAAVIRSLPSLMAGWNIALKEKRFSPKLRLSQREVVVWMLLVTMAAPLWQWGERVTNLGTGLPLHSWLRIWFNSGSMVSSTLILLLTQSRRAFAESERARLREEEQKAVRRAGVPRNPLGLGPSA